jgi:pyroglutamyl-peptidase
MIPRPKILFTAFKPFAGRAVNGSETIVKFLKTWKSPYNIKTVIMDVVWGEVERTGLAAIKAFDPDMVLALGEGEPGIISLETAGVNLRSGTDNAGVAANGEIEPGCPAKQLSRFGFSFKSNTSYKYPVIMSGDAGRFLCNNALYTFLGTDVRRVLFAHLPPQGKAPSKKYIDSTFPIVKDLLKSNFPWIE